LLDILLSTMYDNKKITWNSMMLIAWLVLQSATWEEEDVELETSSDWRSWVSSSKQRSTHQTLIESQAEKFHASFRCWRLICSFFHLFLLYIFYTHFNPSFLS
jgi:hypothetical protein